MSLSAEKMNRLPPLLTAGLGGGVLFLALSLSHVISADALVLVGLAAVLLGFGVFAAVHHAEVLALKLGEPFGSILLALAVTVIETALILSQMSSGKAGAAFIGRDTVFSAVILVLNGIVGLCLVIGGWQHREQEFKLDGASAALSVLATLTVLTLILPSYTLTTPGPAYSHGQLAFVAVVSLVLYGVFVFVQTVRHRDKFVDEAAEHEHSAVPKARTVIISGILLPVALVAVVLLAKFLSAPIVSMVAGAGLPPGFVGVIIAAIVLLPEGFSAVKSAAANQLQTSLNLALGSAAATIGLTIPVLAVAALWQGVPLTLGISPQATVMLVLTLFVSSITLTTGRTTILQGAVHLVICGVFLFLSAVP